MGGILSLLNQVIDEQGWIHTIDDWRIAVAGFTIGTLFINFLMATVFLVSFP